MVFIFVHEMIEKEFSQIPQNIEASTNEDYFEHLVKI